MAIFAVTYRYEADQSEGREANKPAHRKWLADRVEEGTVLTVGPFLDGSGALLLVESDTEETTRMLVYGDPHCIEGFVPEVTVREWKPILGALS